MNSSAQTRTTRLLRYCAAGGVCAAVVAVASSLVDSAADGIDAQAMAPAVGAQAAAPAVDAQASASAATAMPDSGVLSEVASVFGKATAPIQIDSLMDVTSSDVILAAESALTAGSTAGKGAAWRAYAPVAVASAIPPVSWTPLGITVAVVEGTAHTVRSLTIGGVAAMPVADLQATPILSVAPNNPVLAPALPALAPTVAAKESATPAVTATVATGSGAPASTSSASKSPFERHAVAADRLAAQRGGASVTQTTVDIGGAVRDNSATNVVTGTNVIRDGSFGNSVGFNTVIQNSGANVLIQNSTTVNVQFR